MNLERQNVAPETPPTKPRMVLWIAFLLAFWIIGVVLAVFFGLGWFFALGTMRRLFIAVPGLYIRITRVLMGEERAEQVRINLSGTSPLIKWHYALQAMIVTGWFTLTVFVFAYMNIRLIELFIPRSR